MDDPKVDFNITNLDGMADVVSETHFLGVLMPVVPCLLYSSRRLDGASILRVSNLKQKLVSLAFRTEIHQAPFKSFSSSSVFHLRNDSKTKIVQWGSE